MNFVKLHGLGNDFVFIDCTAGAAYDFNAIAPKLCHRQTGIGADGLLLALPSRKADIRMRIVNSDGSEAEMCGNGIRAFSKYAYETGLVKSASFTVETLAGVMNPALILEGNTVMGVCVDMGEPGLESADVPTTLGCRCIAQPITAAGKDFDVTSVRMGVPHTMVPVEDPKDCGLSTYGPAIEHHPLFPQRTNVNFVRVIDRNHIEMRTWERGCGPTLACGTGASAMLVCCVLNGLTEREADVQVELGTLHIRWNEKDNHVYMTGPAAVAFTGSVNVEKL